MTKIVVEIFLAEMVGETIIAEQLKKTLQSTLQGSLNHPAIKKVEINIEP